MAFAVKIDYAGLVEATKNNNVATLLIRDSNLNGTEEKYQPMGQNGDVDVGTEVFGQTSAPSNSYGLKANVSLVAGAIRLGKIVTITTGEGASQVSKKYALENVKIVTKAGGPVEISATAKQVEDSASDASVYWIPALSLSTKQEAQNLFGAFTMSGSGCHLIQCEAEIACAVNTDDVAGVIVSSDCNSGIITVTGTILSTSDVPTVTPLATAVSLGNSQTSNWIATKSPAMSEQNPEKAAKQYTFELQLPLKKAVVQQQQGAT